MGSVCSVVQRIACGLCNSQRDTTRTLYHHTHISATGNINTGINHGIFNQQTFFQSIFEAVVQSPTPEQYRADGQSIQLGVLCRVPPDLPAGTPSPCDSDDDSETGLLAYGHGTVSLCATGSIPHDISDDPGGVMGRGQSESRAVQYDPPISCAPSPLDEFNLEPMPANEISPLQKAEGDRAHGRPADDGQRPPSPSSTLLSSGIDSGASIHSAQPREATRSVTGGSEVGAAELIIDASLEPAAPANVVGNHSLSRTGSASLFERLYTGHNFEGLPGNVYVNGPDGIEVHPSRDDSRSTPDSASGPSSPSGPPRLPTRQPAAQVSPGQHPEDVDLPQLFQNRSTSHPYRSNPSVSSSYPRGSVVSNSPRIGSGDIVVLVMGVVGAGKSTFVNALLSNCSPQRMKVGDSLASCTETANHAIISPETLTRILGYEATYRLVLVDTPGFDAGNKTDSDGVLQEIMSWSRSLLPDDQKCRGGVIFMHDIAPDRSQGEKELMTLNNVFNRPPAPPRLVVVTSKWGQLRQRGIDANGRHKVLVDRFKKTTFHQFQHDEDAWKIMKKFLPQVERGAMLNIGKEFGNIKAQKQESEQLYQKRKKSTLSNLFRLDSFLKRD